MAAVDKTPHETQLDSPADDIFDIVLDVDFPYVTRAIRAETAGNVILITKAGNQRTARFKDGETRPIRAVKALSGTTATGLEGMR